MGQEFKSTNDVKLFPSAYRTADETGKLTSEFNFSNILRSLQSDDIDGYVISYSSIADNKYSLKFVIHGYYFDVTLDEGELVPDLWANIAIESGRNLVSYIDHDHKLDNDTNFLGLKLTKNQDEIIKTANIDYYSLQLTDEKGKIIKYKMSAKDIKYSNGNSIADEVDKKQNILQQGNGIELKEGQDDKEIISISPDLYKSISSLTNRSGDDSTLSYFDNNGISTKSSKSVGELYTKGVNSDTSTTKSTSIYMSSGKFVEGTTIFASTNKPTVEGKNGDIWIKYVE